MEKTKKIKLFIGLSYLLIVSLFLYFFFSKFSLQEITSYDFLRNNRSYLIELKHSNLFLVSISFLFLTVLWVFPFLGFGSPVALMGGFIFGKWIGTLVVVTGLRLFNVRVKNFLFATFLGIIPQIFLAVSIGSGIEKVIDQNSEVPGIMDIIFSPDIYVPLLAFFVLIVFSIIFRKKFYRN